MPTHPGLPTALERRLRADLAEEYDRFAAALEHPAVRGLRIATAKVDGERLARILEPTGARLEPVSWCPSGYARTTAARLGDTLAHHAGLYYLQEPSAMAPAEVLAAGARALGPSGLAGARVIDLAAAPGGKTSRLVELVGLGGLVVANDVERRRLGTLHENLDRWGARGLVTTSRPVEELATLAPGAFDAVMLDAPCSGEGLIRRTPEAAREWTEAGVRGCARRQRALIAAAAELVAPGGVVVYSTCTFGVEENEAVVESLLAARPDWELLDARIDPVFAPGVRLERMARLWPHRLAGEGQVVALLRAPGEFRAGPDERPETAGVERSRTRAGGTASGRGRDRGLERGRERSMVRGRDRGSRPAGRGREQDPLAGWEAFAVEALDEGGRAALGSHRVGARGAEAYALPIPHVPLPPDVVIRPGLPLGRALPGRFEPAPALAGVLRDTDVRDAVTWPEGDERWAAYLGGAEVPDPGPDGWVLVTAYAWGIGWARRRGGVLKNFLPAARRTR